MRSKPSRSAWALTKPEPGTTKANFTLGATFLPIRSTTFAAARMSSIRLLVHEPINTLSIEIAFKGVLGTRFIYSNARSIAARLLGSRSFSGSGTRSLIARTISGDVPQVTCGAISSARNSTTASNFASGSECKVLQYCKACNIAGPLGAYGRP